MKNNPMHRRIGYSLAGIREGLRRERSVRAHVTASIIAIVALAVVQPPLIWCAIAGILLVLGLALELINGAIETLCDRLHPDRHPEIGAVKDMASGGVLLVNTAAALVTVGVLIASA